MSPKQIRAANRACKPRRSRAYRARFQNMNPARGRKHKAKRCYPKLLNYIFQNMPPQGDGNFS